MRYEVYGIGEDGSYTSLSGAHSSLDKAFVAARDMNEVLFPQFIILEKVRKNQAPIGCHMGNTVDGYAYRSASFITGFNPVHSQLDFQAFRDNWYLKPVESYNAYQNRKAEYGDS